MLSRLIHQIKTWGSLIKFSHTIFALPFALSMFIVAMGGQDVGLQQLIWILIALASARTAAMAFNRLLDRCIDSLNPRTESRELPSGKISVTSVYLLLILAAIVFHWSAWNLGLHCLKLAPFTLGFLLFYSWTKRFTRYSHLVLGFALGLAPGGVWYALNATFAFSPMVMMFAVMFWVAGFDIIYSCQDVDFDRAQGLFSLPATVGVDRSLFCARIFHLISVFLLVWFGALFKLGLWYFLGLAAFALILASQHLIVTAQDLSRVNAAFFTRNGMAGFVYLMAVAADRFF